LLYSHSATRPRTGWPLSLNDPQDRSTSNEAVRSGSSPAGGAKRRQDSHEVRGFFHRKKLDEKFILSLSKGFQLEELRETEFRPVYYFEKLPFNLVPV